MYLHYPVFLPVRWHFLNLKGETDKMRRLALAIAMACVLSGVIHAGEIHTTGAVAPPPPSTVTATGEIPTTGMATAGEIHSTGVSALQDSTTVLTVILTLLSIVP